VSVISRDCSMEKVLRRKSFSLRIWCVSLESDIWWYWQSADQHGIACDGIVDIWLGVWGEGTGGFSRACILLLVIIIIMIIILRCWCNGSMPFCCVTLCWLLTAWHIPLDLSFPTSAFRSATYNLVSTTLKYRSETFLLGSSTVKHEILTVRWIHFSA